MSGEGEKQPWMDSPWIYCGIDYENDCEEVLDASKIAWFDVKMDLSETEQEKKERIETMQEQIKLGILQQNGYPQGMNVPNGAHVIGAVPQKQNNNTPVVGFNFPGAVGIPLPEKFNPTPVTKNLKEFGNVNRNVGVIPSLIKNNSKVSKDSILDKGDERLKRIQELTRDRRR
jgi:hypothetical protein